MEERDGTVFFTDAQGIEHDIRDYLIYTSASCDRPYAASVNRAQYCRDISRYEAKLWISNKFRRCLEILLSVTILLLLIAASGANGEGDAVILVIAVLIGLLGLEVLLLKVPQPKIPKGIAVANGRYVIVDPRVHPGFSRVLVGRSCIFRDERLVRVRPYL